MPFAAPGKPSTLRSSYRFGAEVNCPECGAAGNTCEAQFHECLGKESEDSGFMAVHHLLVATYMLQHSSKLTKEGWSYERELLRSFLVENKSPALNRQQNKDAVDSGKRKFKITSRDGLPVIDKTAWTKRILDVRDESAEAYCESVTAWARSVLEDAQEIGLSS
jgi:hypothetical protein